MLLTETHGFALFWIGIGIVVLATVSGPLETRLMPLRLGALHDALLHPGDADLATKAAEELAGYDSRLAGIDTRLSVLTWMVATLVVLQIALGLGNLWLLFTILSRLP